MSIWKEPTSKNAYILGCIGVILTLIASIAGIGFYLSNGSVLCLVFGLENVVDLLSDFVVVWRFYSPGRLTREHEELLQRRELRASVAISFILVLLGLSVIATSLDDFVSGPETDQELKAVIVIAFTSVFIFGTLAIFKFHYARKLESESLYKDGICSLIGTVMAAALFVNTLIIHSNSSLWYLDPLVASLCGAVALIYGLQSILYERFRNQVPVFSCAWWFNASSTSPDRSIQADAEAEINGGGFGSNLEMNGSTGTSNSKFGTTKLSSDLV